MCDIGLIWIQTKPNSYQVSVKINPPTDLYLDPTTNPPTTTVVTTSETTATFNPTEPVTSQSTVRVVATTQQRQTSTDSSTASVKPQNVLVYS